MASGRTIEPEFKKRAIPQNVRRVVALRHGAIPEETTEIACTNCGHVGSAWWPVLYASNRPGSWVHFAELELDHIHPESRGGSTDDPDNFTLLCRPCNRRKGARV